MRWLFDPTTPGMDADTLRARPLPFLAILLGIVGMGGLRYFSGHLNHSGDQAVLVGIGLAWAALVLGVSHGSELARVPTAVWRRLGIGIALYLVFWYFGRGESFDRWLGPLLQPRFRPSASWAWFCTMNGLILVLPALGLARALDGSRPADLGFYAGKHPDRPRVWPVYGLALLVVLPFVLNAATQPAFIRHYPLWSSMFGPEGPTLGQLLLAEGLYALSFIAVEGFFRGYLLFGTERGLGLYALAIAAIPYTAGHFGKPMPEALGAIAAACALGFLALKHRSIWLGVGLHVFIAWLMDAMALLQR